MPYERSLDEVIALAVAGKPLFLGSAVAAHEVVIGFENILAWSVGSEQAERKLARFIANANSS